MKKLFLALLFTTGLLLISGCSQIISNDKITYQKVQYQRLDQPILDTYNGVSAVCTKIGSLRGSDVYAIDGVDSRGWIYLDNDAMMSDSPIGLYKSSKVAKTSLENFGADQFSVYSMSKSQPEEMIYDTKDAKIISQIISSITNGKSISNQDLNKMKPQKEFAINFHSRNLPHIIYQYDYFEMRDQNYYVSFEDFSRKTNDAIHSLISNIK